MHWMLNHPWSIPHLGPYLVLMTPLSSNVSKSLGNGRLVGTPCAIPLQEVLEHELVLEQVLFVELQVVE